MIRALAMGSLLAAAAMPLAAFAAVAETLHCPRWEGADYRPLLSMEIRPAGDAGSAAGAIVCRYRIGAATIPGKAPCTLDPISRTTGTPPAGIVRICDIATGSPNDCSVVCTGQ